MTRSDLAVAISDLSDDDKLDLLGELWDALDHSGPVPEWHQDELDRRDGDAADPAAFPSWSEAKARILGST
jgi:hypothetical protein